MKKTVILTLVLCLTLSAILGFVFGQSGIGKAAATAAPEEAETEAAAPEQSAGRLDFEALYALHAPEEIIMTIGEREVSWGEYFYYLYRQATSIESYLDSMSLYGLNIAWTDALEEDSPATYLDYAVEIARQTAVSLCAMSGYPESLGVTLSEESLASLAEKEQADYTAACGEGATREDFMGFLASIYLPEDVYDYMNRASVLYQQGYLDLYGQGGEKLPDTEAITWLEKNEYMAANHILLTTIDMTSREALDEETKAAKLAQAQSIADELRGIEDTQALLERFAALKEEHDEDTGKAVYPEGYVFTPGTMVSEFEEAVKAQDTYQVSDPVESAYGYHVIMNMPLDPDAVIQYSSAGVPMTARALAANEAYTEAVDAYALALPVEWKVSFESADLLAFVR